MKRFLVFLLLATFLLSNTALAEVDAYTSASTTKIPVTGEELTALEETLTCNVLSIEKTFALIW